MAASVAEVVRPGDTIQLRLRAVINVDGTLSPLAAEVCPLDSTERDFVLTRLEHGPPQLKPAAHHTAVPVPLSAAS